ncbi:MAG: diguanylate cyclase [Rhodospirillales bacterium]|jgi:diguanylate cyclase (GGDEF)-like protein|nr:diguanylate cyclase [Rhodospirillales bacterium]
MAKKPTSEIKSNLSNHLTFFGWVMAVVWTLVVGGSLLLDRVMEENELVALAKASARTSIEKDIIYRSWNSHYGGVYVAREPNSASDIFLPDGLFTDKATTEDGTFLTLVTPSIMTRQVSELGSTFGVESGHLASLIPLNAKNAPDPWEEKALRAFDWETADEVSAITIENGTEYLRMMRPLVLAKECLPCHAYQGYRLGEVRGGISQRVPMAPLRVATERHLFLLGGGHAFLWLVGLGGIIFGHRRLAEQVGQRDRAEERIRHLATHDDLTGVPNRKLLLERLERSIERSRRNGLRTALLFIDLDGFKEINDTLGHDAGDAVLVEVGARLSGCIRKIDTVSRVGGDEFVIVLSDLPDTESVARVANEALELLCDPIRLAQNVVSVGASVGIAFFPDDAGSAEELICVADEAMYEVKGLGKNGFCFADKGRMDTLPISITKKPRKP